MPLMQNQTFLDFELCEEAVSVESGITEVDVIDLRISKQASCDMVVVGKDVCYTVTIVNNSDVSLDVTFRDPLDVNAVYVEESFTITVGSGQPVQVEPTIDPVTNIMTHPITIPAGETVVVEFCVTVKLPDEDNGGGDDGDEGGEE